MKALTAGSFLALAVAGTDDAFRIARRGVARLSGLSGSLGALLLARAAGEAGRLVVVVSDEAALTALRGDLTFLLPEMATPGDRSAPALLSFPALEADPYQGIGAHPQVLAERAGTLWRMRREPRWVVVVPGAALWAPLMPVERFEALGFAVEEGGELEFDELTRRLEAAGYGRVDMASSPGDWARRGGIFDTYPPGQAEPTRIELVDDRIASIRLFDPLTQRSLERRQAVEIPPAREAPLGAEDRQDLLLKLERMPRTGGRLRTGDPLESLAVEGTFPGVEACTGLWAGRETDLLDYAGGAALALVEPFSLETELGAVLTQLAGARRTTEGPLPEPERLLLPPARLAERLASPRLEIHDLGLDDIRDDPEPESCSVLLGGRAPRTYFGQMKELVTDLSRARRTNTHTLLLLESEGTLERCREVLEEGGLEPVTLPATVPAAGRLPRLALGRVRLRHGFEHPASGLTVLTEREIFGESRQKRPRGGRRAAPFRSDFRDLKVGDLVVHVDQGIGRYQGIRRLGGERGEKEFMVLVYRNDNVL